MEFSPLFSWQRLSLITLQQGALFHEKGFEAQMRILGEKDSNHESKSFGKKKVIRMKNLNLIKQCQNSGTEEKREKKGRERAKEEPNLIIKLG